MTPAPERPQTVSLAAIPGDDIGPEIVAATVAVLGAATTRRGVTLHVETLPGGEAAVGTHGSTLPDETLEALRRHPGALLGPVGHGRYPVGDPRYPNPSGVLRKRLDLYANIRPARTWTAPEPGREPIDLVVVRENTEGFYADRNVLDGNGELRPDEDTVMSVRVVTRRACLRIAEQAFAVARARGRPDAHVIAVHKANVLRRGDGLFLECCREVAERYPDVALKDRHVDAFAAELVTDPARIDVVVTTNMFGDILSDIAAALVGGLGLAPGLNAGDAQAVAQATHGSAPDIEPTSANPIAEILSGGLLLDWLGRAQGSPVLEEAARDVEAAVERVLRSGEVRTPDLGGTATTAEVADAIVGALGDDPA